MKKPQISVIVPVYKAEQYLHRCIDCILAQTYSDFELILIDDGSPDNSGGICDEYAQKDSRIKVIHKKNGGVASARQCGIDNATGIYTIHADPDDWMEHNMLEELHNKAIAENADMVICDFYDNIDNIAIYRKQQISENSPQDVLQDLLFHKLHGSLWNKLIRRSCYTDYNVSFIENLNYCEDYLVCVKMLMNNLNIAYLDKAYYFYDHNINENSITRKYTIETYKQRILFIEKLKEALHNKYPDAIMKNKAIVAMECLRYGVLTKKEYKKTYKKEKWSLVKFITGRKRKLKFIIATTF